MTTRATKPPPLSQSSSFALTTATPRASRSHSRTPSNALPPANLSGIWQLDTKHSTPLLPLLRYHHQPASLAQSLDTCAQCLVVTHGTGALIVQHYTESSVTGLLTPFHSLSYAISDYNTVSVYYPVRDLYRSYGSHSPSQSRCYRAPHGQSVIVDTKCQSKYDLQRVEMYLDSTDSSQLIEEIRILSCDPALPAPSTSANGGGNDRQSVSMLGSKTVATPFASEFSKPVIAKNKQVVRELLMVKRVWQRIDEAKFNQKRKLSAESANQTVSSTNGNGTSSDLHKQKETGDEKYISDVSTIDSAVAERKYDDTGARPRKLSAATPTETSRKPSTATSSPIESAAGNIAADTGAAGVPAPDLSGSWLLNESLSQSLTPIAHHYHIKIPAHRQSNEAARRQQSRRGTKPSPASIQPPCTEQIIIVRQSASVIETRYFIVRRVADHSKARLAQYPIQCYHCVAVDQFLIDEQFHSPSPALPSMSLHPNVPVKCFVKPPNPPSTLSSLCLETRPLNGSFERTEARIEGDLLRLTCQLVDEVGMTRATVERVYERISVTKLLDSADTSQPIAAALVLPRTKQRRSKVSVRSPTARDGALHFTDAASDFFRSVREQESTIVNPTGNHTHVTAANTLSSTPATRRPQPRTPVSDSVSIIYVEHRGWSWQQVLEACLFPNLRGVPSSALSKHRARMLAVDGLLVLLAVVFAVWQARARADAQSAEH